MREMTLCSQEIRSGPIESQTLLGKKQPHCLCNAHRPHVASYAQVIEDMDAFASSQRRRGGGIMQPLSLRCSEEDKNIYRSLRLPSDDLIELTASLANDEYDNEILLNIKNQEMDDANMSEDSTSAHKESQCLFCNIFTRSIWILMIAERQPYYGSRAKIHCGLINRPNNGRFNEWFSLQTLFSATSISECATRLVQQPHVHQVSCAVTCKQHPSCLKKKTLESTGGITLEEIEGKEFTVTRIHANTCLDYLTLRLYLRKDKEKCRCSGLETFIHYFKQCQVEFLNGPSQFRDTVYDFGAFTPSDPRVLVRVAMRIFKQMMELFIDRIVLQDVCRITRLRAFWKYVLAHLYPMPANVDTDLLSTLFCE